MGKCGTCIKKYGDLLYFVGRVVVGLMFMLHGGQKLFGWFGGVGGDGASVALVSLMGLAGVVEFFGGLGIALGLFSRLLAGLGAIQMIIAYFKVHFGAGWNPLLNQGELALLYLAAFLMISVLGNGKWNLEKSLLGKETF